MTLLLDDAGASVTGDTFTFNGGLKLIQFTATNFGAGIIVEGRISSDLPYSPLTYFGATTVASPFLDSRIIRMPLCPNGFQIRAKTTAGCVGVTVGIIPSSIAEN